MRVVTIVLFALTLPFAIAYSIENCGPHQTDIEYAVTLAQTTMIRPLLDVATGTRSIHGFSAMFKSDNFKAFVQQLMTNILHLPPTPILAMLRDPIFVCVTNDVVRTYNPGYDPWTACQAREDVYGFYAKDTPWIFICSSFLEKLTPYPMFTPGGPLDIYCPIVQNNAFVGRPGPLVGYQNYQLVHLLAHFYLQGASLSEQTVPKEVMDWNECVGLGVEEGWGSQSCRNPFNLVYYAAMVNQECTQFPDPHAPPFLGSNNLTSLAVNNGNSPRNQS